MISVYCSEKLDGVAAAAIVMRHAVLSKLPVHFGGFLHPDSLEDELVDMAGDEHKLIFVLDVSVSPDVLPLLDAVNKKNKLVYWTTNDSESVVPPSKIFDRAVERKCSAELAMARFLPNDLIAKRLATLAHEVKFWQLHDESALKLSDLIQAQYSPVELLDSLSKGVFWSEHFERAHKDYVARKSVALDDMMRSLVVKSYVNYRFGFALVGSLLSSADACQRMLDGHAGVDVACVLYRDGRVAFRRRDGCDVDVKSVAGLFKGGGKPFAAGACLPMAVSKESLSDVLFYLDQALRNYFISAVP